MTINEAAKELLTGKGISAKLPHWKDNQRIVFDTAFTGPGFPCVSRQGFDDDYADTHWSPYELVSDEWLVEA
jgi:hypothetical protein